jgi:hypothetical protein
MLTISTTKAMRAIDVIVNHAPLPWSYSQTGETYFVVWAAPMEVIAIAMTGAWLGRATKFVEEFEPL